MVPCRPHWTLASVTSGEEEAGWEEEIQVLTKSSVQSLCNGSRGHRDLCKLWGEGPPFSFGVETKVSIGERKSGTKNVRREKKKKEGSQRLNGFQSGWEAEVDFDLILMLCVSVSVCLCTSPYYP